jgi:long-chain acyl-CoA synthetase
MKSYDITYYETFPAFLSGIAAAYGDKPAVSWFTRRQEQETRTYAQLDRRVRALSAALCAQGLAGRHIAVVGENSYDWICAFLAIVSCGGVAVCIDTEQSDEDIRSMLVQSDAEAAFASPTFLPICAPLGERIRMFPMGGAADDPLSIDALCALEAELPDCGVAPDQTAAIVFTSGTTSQPKLVMLSHRNILYNFIDSAVYVEFGARTYCSLPFYHTYGLTCGVLGSLYRGTHLFINGDLRTSMRDLRLAEPETMLTVPLVVEAIYHQICLAAEKAGTAEQLKKLLGRGGLLRRARTQPIPPEIAAVRDSVIPGLRVIISGGAHLGREISGEFERLGVMVLQGYGITECSPLIAVNRLDACRMGTVGHPMPHCQVKLVEEEVWASGASIMQGYYGEPELTAEVLEDGWFKTGDLGFLDKDGFLTLTGRKKNLIVFKNGKKISPEKLEERISQFPLVREVLVHGTQSGAAADDVKLTASIFPDPQRCEGMSSYEILHTLQAEIDRINASLPSYQQIQMVNIREREFSKTGTKKIKRNLV